MFLFSKGQTGEFDYLKKETQILVALNIFHNFKSFEIKESESLSNSVIVMLSVSRKISLALFRQSYNAKYFFVTPQLLCHEITTSE